VFLQLNGVVLTVTSVGLALFYTSKNNRLRKAGKFFDQK